MGTTRSGSVSGREIDEDDAIGKGVAAVRRRRRWPARLADAAGTGERQQPHIVVPQLAHAAAATFRLAPDEAGQRRRQRDAAGEAVVA